MKTYFILHAFFCSFFIIPFNTTAQLCTGSLGDPVVNITFGAGSNPGPALNSNLTNISYFGNDCPNDGYYSIRNTTSNCYGDAWHHLTGDHTGDPGGYFMLVNASYQPSDFYVEKVDGLCPNTTYQFAAWILNLLKNADAIRPNLTFNIEKPDGTVIKSFNTGVIPAESYAEWKQYGFFFTSSANNEPVIVRIRNNAPGGIGNDLCLDDITFSPCGPQVMASISGSSTDSSSLCEGNITPISLSGKILAGYVNPAYQWQVIENGTGWADIPGANSIDFVTTPTRVGVYRFRLAVAESGNLGMASCRVNSNVIDIYVRGKPGIHFASAIPPCEGTMALLEANVNFNSTAASGINWLTPNPSITGTPSMIPGDSANKGILRYTISDVSMAASGNYRLQVTSLYGCMGMDSFKLVVKPRPSADFSLSSSICEKAPLTFIGTASIQSPDSIISYYWNFGNGESAAIVNPTRSYINSG